MSIKLTCPADTKTLFNFAHNTFIIASLQIVSKTQISRLLNLTRAECYDFWVDKVSRTLEMKGDDRVDFDELKEMHKEATDRKYPDTDLLSHLQMTVEEAEKCQTVANQLGSKKVRSDFKFERIPAVAFMRSRRTTIPFFPSGFN
jgi:hypothetical protein